MTILNYLSLDLSRDFLVCGIPYVFMNDKPEVLAAKRKAYRTAKTCVMCGSASAVAMKELVELTQDVVTSNIKFHGYRGL